MWGTSITYTIECDGKNPIGHEFVQKNCTPPLLKLVLLFHWTSYEVKAFFIWLFGRHNETIVPTVAIHISNSHK